MPVTELAILRLPNGQPTANLITDLNTAKIAMAAFSGYPFYYFHCIEDPIIVYIIGTWPSVEFHMDQWIPSTENQNLLRLLEGQLTVDAMFHVDIDRTVRPIPTDSSVLAIGRHFLAAGQRAGFTQVFEQGRRHLDDFAGESNVVGGWRIDNEDEDKEEFVLFTGWESKLKHLEFATTEGYPRYRKIVDFMIEVDIKHAKLLDTRLIEHQ